MEINFYIRTKKDRGNIRVWVSDKGSKFFATTDIQIPVAWWDEKKGCLKTSFVPAAERRQIDARLSEIKALIIESNITSSEHLSAVITQQCIAPAQLIINLMSDKYMIYIREAGVCDRRKQAFLSLYKKMVRYEKIHGGLKFETAADLKSFENFLMIEPQLYDKYPELYPGGKAKERGQNYVNDLMRRLRTFLIASGNNVFKSYEMKENRYADPIAHTLEELDVLWNYKPVTAYLERVKDMYLLHCYIGARVSDYVALKRMNVQDGILVYIANKGIAKSQKTVYVPLSSRAMQIIEKYDDPDRLITFINVYGAFGYNNGIKLLLQAAGINRIVYTINTVTSLPELRPLCEVASTHTARKTFISCVLNSVKSEYITSKMTDHVEGSKVLKRYGNINVDTLKDVIKDVFK